MHKSFFILYLGSWGIEQRMHEGNGEDDGETNQTDSTLR